ncbi:hypothetical protein C5167_023976 [Papaver somniferum]|uniref:Piwi domain-containing protein n=1 Tax=Papaver somniferum TaxID=3469 RepID=A0A4Y7JQX4_PAPSO|nr:hypothetical protein C5167_023976 [Papaver somniferum]
MLERDRFLRLKELRDGVSESQFNHFLNIELDKTIKAWEFLDKDAGYKPPELKLKPKFIVITAQENRHTKFFSEYIS